MATMATPRRDDDREPRPNIPSASNPAARRPRLRAGRPRDHRDAAARRSGWFALLGVAILCLLIGAGAWIYQIHEGLGAAGYNPPVMWGVYIITFVFWVGIGHAGTLISAILYLFRAGFRTTIYRVRGSDDGVRRHDGRPLPDPPPRAAVEVLLADSVSELAAHLAELQEPARLGRLRDPHVPHGLGDVPLRRPHSRHRGAARPGDEPGPQAHLRGARRSAGGTRIASGATSRAPTCSSPRSPRRSCSRCTRSCRSTSRWRSRRAGTRRSSRPTSSPAPSSRASGWCSRSSSRSGSSSSSSTTSRSTTSTRRPSSASSRRWSSGSRTSPSSRSPGCSGNAVRAGRTSGTASSASGGGPRGSCSSATWSCRCRSSRRSCAATRRGSSSSRSSSTSGCGSSASSSSCRRCRTSSSRGSGAATRRRGSTTSILLGCFGWFFMWFLLFIKQLPVMAISEVKEIVPPRAARVARPLGTTSTRRASILTRRPRETD